MARVFVGVGSSVEPEAHVRSALARLGEAIGLVRVSTFYATPALGRPSDPSFVNGAVEIRDRASPAALKEVLSGIERMEGRRRGGDRFAPRPIDLDLLVHGDAVSTTPELPLPHPDVTHRRFVAVPLLELAPDLVLPGSGLSLAAVVEGLPPHPMEPLPMLTRELREMLR
jgi:2-amino-4-hydroxy-6-hydroxymethyldihydropteridine diphosphokinase